MKKLTDEYSLDDWRRLEPDTTYAMVAAFERSLDDRHQAEIERLRFDLVQCKLELEAARTISHRLGTERDECRKLLLEAAEAMRKITVYGGFSKKELDFCALVDLRDRAARAAGGGDE